jgi:hypothetical protein
MAAVSPALATNLQTQVNIYLNGYTLSSDGLAYMYDASVAYGLTGHHRITDSTYAIVKDRSVSVTDRYAATITASGRPGVCYRAYLDITAYAPSTGTTET